MNKSQSKSYRVDMDKVHNEEDRGVIGAVTKKSSMNTLIIWNVSKAVEKNPCMDLKTAIKAAQERLDGHVSDVRAMIPECPEERHLACALLAWRRLGHNDADSLCRFIESYRIKESESIDKASNILSTCENWNNSKIGNSTSFDAYSLTGPVLKLPVDTKIVMRMESVSNSKRPAAKQPPKDDRNLKDKIDAACCMESGCIQRLAEMDALTLELRTRAGRLARREAERVELLERAEAAWKDLELGYQRRITLAKEKESDLTKQTEKLIEERNNHKNEGMSLAQQLKEKGQAMEKDRAQLTKMEKDVCDSACKRLRLGEEAARVDATLAELQCKAAQLDRDLQFKEEQARRKMLSMESELESARALTHEAERALRGELGALREQITQVSDQLLKEDSINTRIKQELENLREEKDGMVEDLEGCKVTCDNKMQGKLDELKKKRDQLTELRERVIECKCKLPIDAAVEVRRTPSFAALCDCKPEDRLLESCSCTSLRTSLLSNLLADLFGGLQAELGGSGSQMPCHLLKCLEDKHNWDRSSVIKTNLRNYFSKLLIGELEIAIATSIEKYHAKWIGASCADVARLIPEPGDPMEDEGWEERALERKAQKMATKLAEQLFQERADQLTQRAKDIISSGPPPCKCGPQPAAFPCLVKSPTVNTGTAGTGNVNTTPYWRRTLQNVTQLRLQIEDLKKDSIKKEDLKVMEEKITQIVTGPDKDNLTLTKDAEKYEKKATHNQSNFDKPQIIKRKPLPLPKPNLVKKEMKTLPSQSSRMDKPYSRTQKKTFNKQSFAINVCLCSSQKDSTKLAAQRKILQKENTNETHESWKTKLSEDSFSQLPSIKQTKPITQLLSQDLNSLENSKIVSNNSCPSNCICFHKIPSNTSINKLLETLEKWKNDLTGSFDGQQKNDFEKKSSVKFEGDKTARKKIQTQSTENATNLKLDTVKTNLDDIKRPNQQSKDLCTETGSKSLEFDRNLALATESEYMGQIILDKSNENICRCNKALIDGNIRDVNQNIDQNSEYTVKCININACGCKNSHKVSCQISNDQCLKKQQSILKKISVSTELNNYKQENEVNEIKNNAISNLINSEINQISKNSEFLPCNGGYFVKFLGVTLTKANCKKMENGKSNNEDREKGFTTEEGELQNIKSFKQWDSQSAIIDKSNVDKNISYHEKNTCTDMPICQCSIKFDEFKEYIDSTFSKQRGDYNLNKDKALDIQSFKNNSFINEEYCVCCGSSNTGEVEDLEVNTYHLLENHLKEKIEDFKTSYCKSSCIPVEEEHKLFETILKRVRKIIERSTIQIECKCSGEEDIQENINRAYCLLKEYLKTKIKRVKCSCVPSQDNENSILPDVMEKVCSLIENDILRLKDICKCRSSVRSNDELKIKITSEEPEKDTQNNITDTKLDIQSKNTSSQVPPNLGMETKSCSCLEDSVKRKNNEKDTHLSSLATQTSRICRCNLSEPKIENFVADKTDDELKNCCDQLNRPLMQSPEHTSYFYQALYEFQNEKLFKETEDHKKIKHEHDVETAVDKDNSTDIQNVAQPYIGYTVDCSCEYNLGSCICTKSIIQKDKGKIHDIWKSVTKNYVNRQNVSYILSNMPKLLNNACENDILQKNISEENIESLEITHTSQNIHCIAQKEKTCERKISTGDESDIMLIESRECDKMHNMTNTIKDSMSLTTDIEVENEDTIEWYECEHMSCHHKPGVKYKDCIKFENALYFPLDESTFLRKRYNSKIFADSGAVTLKTSFSQNCDCNLVPICHVKMLIKNIENKLIYSKCTCDSLSSQVCPVHYVRKF